MEPDREQVERVTADFERRRATIEAATADALSGQTVHEAESGHIRVTVDGRFRVADLYLSAYAVRDPELGALIAAAVRDALESAEGKFRQTLLGDLDPATSDLLQSLEDLSRMLQQSGAAALFPKTAPGGATTAAGARLEKVLNDLPDRVAQAQEKAGGFAGREFTGEATDQSVVATVDGGGKLVEVLLSAAATRRLDNFTLGERAAEAINAALDALDSARAALLSSEDEPDLHGAEELFAYRMDQLQLRLDSIESSLRGMEF
ncbi:YbaB/EbfC family nucleoid-associated protein [Dactylosporangium sp. AC04546]|uniref:YbaB/EbfC family nucleoid-associated protein n=1 Tax=Dactylosporangium sp. AC04546 TaxID=2862460 RepID=UPI001EE153E3|nr:YbaB/EbfC family nucleoid-associated protein [Dactylosporangium sp. AC04546]WVK80502.1 YbaB/EbfC family nucleoid-associated protein [Dactylosporangium sp. AC04546]